MCGANASTRKAAKSRAASTIGKREETSPRREGRKASGVEINELRAEEPESEVGKQLAGRGAVSFVETAGTKPCRKGAGPEPSGPVPDLNAFSLTHHSPQGRGAQTSPPDPAGPARGGAHGAWGPSLVPGAQPGPPGPPATPLRESARREGVRGDPGKKKGSGRKRVPTSCPGASGSRAGRAAGTGSPAWAAGRDPLPPQ